MPDLVWMGLGEGPCLALKDLKGLLCSVEENQLLTSYCHVISLVSALLGPLD